MKLTKIRLVNWHIFNDNTIRLNGNVVFTGENGNGKSTLIDAIYFVLSAGDEYHFNNAANSESARTLNTYIRCKLGIEGHEFKRNEADVVGHIALQFEDSVEGLKKTLGVVIELSGTKAKKYFYILHDKDIDDVSYVGDDNVVADYETLKHNCGKDFETLGGLSGTQKNIRAKIEELLQLSNGENYNTLLKKAIAFVPLNQEITTFVNTFLLKEDNINISDLKQEIDSYRDIQKTLTREKAKLVCLESFVKDADEYQNNKKKLDFLNAVYYKRCIISDNAFIEKKDKDLKTIDNEIAVIKSKTKVCEDDIEKFSDIIRQYKNNDSYRALETNEIKLKERLSSLSIAEQNLKNTESKIALEQNISNELGFSFDFASSIEKGDIVRLNQHLQTYLSDIKEEKEEQNKLKFDKTNERVNVNKEISKLAGELSELEKGRNSYGQDFDDLVESLENNLSEKHNKRVRILPLCECFEITDKRWANAIEGYMANIRFDLVVEPKYFKESLPLFRNVTKARGIYELGLIDTTKNDDLPVMENSLFTKIKIKNPYVETKLRQVLGRVICVDDIEDLPNYRAAITDDVVLYQNYVVKVLRPKKYEKHYIGAESQKQRIEFLNNQLTKERKDVARLTKIINDADEILKIIDQSRFNKEDVIKDVWSEVSELKAQIEEIRTEIAQMKESDDLIGINKQIEVYESKKVEALHDKHHYDDLREEKIEKRGALDNEIQSKKAECRQYQSNYDLIITERDYGEEYFAYEKDFLEKNSSILAVNEERETLNAINSKYAKTINNGIQSYYNSFEKNLGATIDDLDKYIAKYNQIIHTDIVNFEQKAQMAYENARSNFNENFVTVLRTKIRNAQHSLREINAILEKHPFGLDEERYSFVSGPSNDKELGSYYRVINSDKAYGKVDLLVESMSDEDQDIIKQLFERLATDESDSLAAQRLKDVLDYRNYMKYDIKITNKNNESYYFSKIAKEKSGGETQTPFYIVIAACFEELLIKGAHDSSCLIIFDEAFNNMDESRISTLLNYYKKLTKIQFLIGVPTNRAPYLAPSMDTCIGLIKTGTSVDLVYANGTNK